MILGASATASRQSARTKEKKRPARPRNTDRNSRGEDSQRGVGGRDSHGSNPSGSRGNTPGVLAGPPAGSGAVWGDGMNRVGSGLLLGPGLSDLTPKEDSEAGQSPKAVEEPTGAWNKIKRMPTVVSIKMASIGRDSGSKLRDLDAAQVHRRQTGAFPWLTVSCSGTFRQCWDLCSLIAVIYCTFMVPYDMTFDPPASAGVSSAIDMSVEVFFMTEILLNFFTSYINEDGVEIKSKFLIIAQYGLSWLPIDTVSSVPSEIIRRIATADGLSADGSMSILESLRILRILRLTKLLRLLRIANFMEQIEFSFPSLRTVIGLFRLLFLMGTIAHMQACIFYYIASTNIGNSWVSKLHFDCCDPMMDTFTAYSLKTDDISCMDDVVMPDLSSLYANAIYWSFTTLTTVGYGDIVPCNEMEMLFATAAMVVGSALFAYIVGNISSVVTSIKGQELKMKERMRELQEYIALRKIPKQLADQVRRQCMHLWKRTVFEEDKVLSQFTPGLRKEIVSFVNDHILLSVKTFEAFKGEPLLTEIALRLKPASAIAGEIITGHGELFGDLYILQAGKAEVLDENGTVIEAFSTKGSFNELELLSPIYHYPDDSSEPQIMSYTTTLRAVTFCDLMVLKSNDFMDAMNSSTPSDETNERLEKRWSKLLSRMEKRAAFSNQIADETSPEKERSLRKAWGSQRMNSLTDTSTDPPKTRTGSPVRRWEKTSGSPGNSPRAQMSHATWNDLEAGAVGLQPYDAGAGVALRPQLSARLLRPPSDPGVPLLQDTAGIAEGSPIRGRTEHVRGRERGKGGAGEMNGTNGGGDDKQPPFAAPESVKFEDEGKHLGSDEDAKGSLFEASGAGGGGDALDGSAAAAASGERTMPAEAGGHTGGKGWNTVRQATHEAHESARPSLELCVEAFKAPPVSRTPGRGAKPKTGRDGMMIVILQALDNLQERMEEQDRLIALILAASPTVTVPASPALIPMPSSSTTRSNTPREGQPPREEARGEARGAPAGAGAEASQGPPLMPRKPPPSITIPGPLLPEGT